MNPSAVVNRAAQLWPGGKLTDLEVRVWRESLRRFDLSDEQAFAVLDQVRIERGRRSPPLAVINKRLAELAEHEARARAAEQSPIKGPEMDFGKPQGLVLAAIREYQKNPQDPKWAGWKARAVGWGMLTMMRAAWRRWTGTEGPYA